MQEHKTPASLIQLAAAMAALGAYSGDNTEAGHTREAKRLGGGEEYYRLRLVNALPGIIETEAMLSETAGRSVEEMFQAHRQALESAGAMRNKEILLEFLRWRTLRIAGSLYQIGQDEATGPIPLLAAHAAHAAEGLQRLLGIATAGQRLDPATLSPAGIKADFNSTRESLTYAIANLDLMFDLITKAEGGLIN